MTFFHNLSRLTPLFAAKGMPSGAATFTAWNWIDPARASALVKQRPFSLVLRVIGQE